MAGSHQPSAVSHQPLAGRMVSAALLMVLACCTASAAASPPQRFEYSQVAMGVRARIVVYGDSEASAQKACRAAFERIAKLEDIMSDYRPTSEIMRLCSRAGSPPVSVSPELLLMLGISRDLARRSDGAFDPTVGPLVKLWRNARKAGVLPPEEEIAAARKLVGWQKLVIDPESGKVSLRLPGMLLDLGGIAKGYACDEALRVLHEHGISSALIEMGGDIVAGDPPPGKKGWEIEIPNADPANKRIVVANLAVSSSGDTEQFVEIGGKRYSHIVDPKTGLGLTNRVAVTVAATYGFESDGLATAISVQGEKKGKALAGTYPVKWLYVRRAE